MPKLLLDANISWRVARKLQEEFQQVHHVDQIDLSLPAKDIDIWNWAKHNDFIIITNDEDFLYLLLEKGFPPKVVLLRKGNLSTREMSEVILSYKEQIMWLVTQENYGLLEII